MPFEEPGSAGPPDEGRDEALREGGTLVVLVLALSAVVVIPAVAADTAAALCDSRRLRKILA